MLEKETNKSPECMIIWLTNYHSKFLTECEASDEHLYSRSKSSDMLRVIINIVDKEMKQLPKQGKKGKGNVVGNA